MLSIQVLSPKETLFKGHAEMVTLPGIEGDLSILADHIPIATLLRPGSITIHQEELNVIDLPYGGIVHMDGSMCSVFVKLMPDSD